MSGARPLSRVSKAPSRDSIIAFFVIGALLLFVPLSFAFYFGSQPCDIPLPYGASCPPPLLYKEIAPALPFVMIIGGVLIGYNLKRISDSLLPSDEEEGEQDS